ATSSPTSGPPYDTISRSFSLDRRMARTSAIGLRRDPQPPIPIVMPERSSPATSSGLMTATPSALPVPARPPGPLGGGGEAELEREPLFVPVRALDVDGIDAVQRLLGQPDGGGVLGGDLAGHGARGGPQACGRHDVEHGAEAVQLLGRDGPAGVHHGAHEGLGDHTRRTGGRAPAAPAPAR